MFDVYYYGLKFAFLFGLIRSFVKYEVLAKSFLFLGILYTSGVAFLSYVFITSWRPFPAGGWLIQVSQMAGIKPWLCWLGATLVLSVLYFKLLGRFDEGILFWVLIFLAVPLALF